MTTSPTSFEAATDQEAFAKKQHDDMFNKIEEIKIEERAKASTSHRRKNHLRAKSVLLSRTVVRRLVDEPKIDIS